MDTRSVRLVADHTHEGVKHYAGEIISLPIEDAEWLCNTTIATRQEVALAAADMPGTPESEAKKESKADKK